MTPWPRRRELAVLAAILVAYGVLLGRALSYEFVWDDVLEIQNNPAFDRPLVDGLFTTQTARTDPALTELSTIQLAYDSYRPLLFASLWIDVQLWGRSPAPLHAVNLVLGALAICLVYALARRWLAGPSALVPAAVFALHPVQIEAVAYISGRGDVLAGLFTLLAALGAVRSIDATAPGRAAAWCTLAAASFGASLLAKESSIGLPIVVMSILVLERALRSRWWVPASMFAVAAGYLILRAAIVSTTQGSSLRAGLLGLPGIWLEYLRIVLLPFDLSTERLRQPAYVLPGAALVAAVLVVTILAAVRGSLTGHKRTAVIGLIWMGVLSAPAAVPIASMNVVADRYVYVPLFGLAVAVTAGATHLVALRPRLLTPIAITAVLASAVWLFIGWRQVTVWRNNEALYLHAAAMSPDSSMAHYRVGYLHAQANHWDEAIAHFVHATELDPGNLVALNNLGVGYLRTGQPDLAARALSAAVTVNPAHFRAWLNLGLAQWTLGERTRGCESIARALAIHPRYSTALREHRQRCSGD